VSLNFFAVSNGKPTQASHFIQATLIFAGEARSFHLLKWKMKWKYWNALPANISIVWKNLAWTKTETFLLWHQWQKKLDQLEKTFAWTNIDAFATASATSKKSTPMPSDGILKPSEVVTDGEK
jgi:hypothetical protein